MASFLPILEGYMEMSSRVEDAVFLVILALCLVAGIAAGTKFTWGFILVYSIIVGFAAFVSIVTSSRYDGMWHVSFTCGTILFLIGSWCSFWIAVAGVFR